jgi:hypothetical protein
MKAQLTPELLKQLYTNQGQTAKQIAQQTGYCKATILYHLKKFNIPARKEWWLKGRPKITKEFLEQEYVQKGKTIEQIAKETGYKQRKIMRAMQRFGIKTRMKQCREKLNQYYSSIDVGNMTWDYIGGFIDAEGTIYKRHYLYRVSIVNTHKEVLEKIRAFAGYGTLTCRTVKHFGKKPIYTLAFTRKEIAQELSGHLVLKKQKLEELFSVKLAQSAISWAYIAGLFDGDGSVTFSEQAGRCIISIVSQERGFLSLIQDWLRYGRIHEHGAQFVLRIARHEDQIDFCEHVIPYLLIQKDKMEKVKNFIENKNWNAGHKLAGVSREQFIELYWEKRMSIRQIAKKFGCKYNSVLQKFKRMEIPLRNSIRKKEVQAS